MCVAVLANLAGFALLSVKFTVFNPRIKAGASQLGEDSAQTRSNPPRVPLPVSDYWVLRLAQRSEKGSAEPVGSRPVSNPTGPAISSRNYEGCQQMLPVLARCLDLAIL